MHIDWWTLALQAINVLILVWLLARFLFRPVMDAIAARQAAADALLADAQAAKDAATAQAAAAQARIDGAAAEIDHDRAAMQAQVEAERVRLLDQAKDEAAAHAQRAAAADAAERARQVADLERKAGLLAGEIAAKLLRRVPATATNDALFAALLDRLRAFSDEERRRFGSNGPIAIVTPAAIADVQQARYAGDLQAVLPGIATPHFTIDPALIAGFELRGPHILVRNSWRADLDDLLAKLTEDGDGWAR